MNTNVAMTKANLISTKSSLSLAKLGFDLMDKKRNILIRELMDLIEQAKGVQSEIDSTFTAAYRALQDANIELGLDYVREIAQNMPIENSIKIKARSVMGTEIPLIESEVTKMSPNFAFFSTKEALDIAIDRFLKVKELTIKLTMIEISAYRLATSIKKTQKRANALKNITIPTLDRLAKNIANSLEEKEREEFTRLKVIKRQKSKNAM